MRKLFAVSLLTLIVAAVTACAGDEPDPGRHPLTKADVGAGSCAGACGDQAKAGCWCDEACALIGDCCGDVGMCEKPASDCAELGGSCLSSKIDVTFPADCAEEFGLVASDASCRAINQACCVPSGNDTCADVGGACLSSPDDVGFAADCERDFGLQVLEGSCVAINHSCCGFAPAGG